MRILFCFLLGVHCSSGCSVSNFSKDSSPFIITIPVDKTDRKDQIPFVKETIQKYHYTNLTAIINHNRDLFQDIIDVKKEAIISIDDDFMDQCCRALLFQGGLNYFEYDKLGCSLIYELCLVGRINMVKHIIVSCCSSDEQRTKLFDMYITEKEKTTIGSYVSKYEEITMPENTQVDSIVIENSEDTLKKPNVCDDQTVEFSTTTVENESKHDEDSSENKQITISQGEIIAPENTLKKPDHTKFLLDKKSENKNVPRWSLKSKCIGGVFFLAFCVGSYLYLHRKTIKYLMYTSSNLSWLRRYLCQS